MKLTAFVLCMVFAAGFCFAENEGVRLIPMLNYEFVSVENQRFHAPGGGLVLLNGNPKPHLSEKYNTLMIGLFYKPYILEEDRPGYSELYHDVDFTIEKRTGAHLFQCIFTSYSDKPVCGGFHTAFTSIGYGYELIRKENLNLTLGLALVAGDFGIKLPNGNMWPLLPTPIIRFGFNSSIIKLMFNFPELSLVLLPESKVRVTGSLIWDTHDLWFNAILWYRFFDKNFTAGDILGIGLGVKNIGQNDGSDFVLGEKDKKYNMSYYSVFGVLDVGLLKLSGGYIFDSGEVYDVDYKNPAGKGFFIKIELLYQFKMKK